MKTAASASTLTISNTTYNPDGSLNTMTNNNGDTDAYTYDPNTGRMTQFKFTVGATPKTMTGTLTWNVNGTLRTLGIVDQFNAANSQTCNYGTSTVAGYDDLGRLVSVNCGTPWSQTFSYDQYGNLQQKAGNGPFQAFYNSATNRFTSISGEATPSYDANGNLLNTEGHTYAWDANWGNPSTVDGNMLTYDALGRMVEIQNGTTTTQVMYGPTGKVATMHGLTEVLSFEPLPAGTFVHQPGSLTNFIRHADWLGTSRFASTMPARTLFFDSGYGPFGEQYVSSGTTDLSYTGMMQDVTSLNGGIYDFMFRKYSPVQGRWISPDPAGMSAVNPSNPQTWNRYTYVANRPSDSVDELGLRLLFVFQ